MLTYHEEALWKDLTQQNEQWLTRSPFIIQKKADIFFEKLMRTFPEKKTDLYFHTLDKGLFQLHAFIQSTTFQFEMKKKIIERAKLFHEDIFRIEDVKMLPIDKLMYIADSEISRHRIYSLVQGGITGFGGAPLLLADLPLMAVINLKIVQLIGMCYGYDSIIPYEMMISLKVFHGGTMPVRLQEEAWKSLIDEIKNKEDEYFYLGVEQLTDYTWLEQPLRQIIKMMAIQTVKRKVIQGIPVIGVGVGAMTNYQLTKQVTEFAHRFYQYRFLYEKQEKRNEL